ncbi:hypothetical protein GX48_00781 [Paracoccidioides brasiliensis]|nr:hypothetical protein GX48_00781 [Paracoccidioides brasiliensis]
MSRTTLFIPLPPVQSQLTHKPYSPHVMAPSKQYVCSPAQSPAKDVAEYAPAGIAVLSSALLSFPPAMTGTKDVEITTILCHKCVAEFDVCNLKHWDHPWVAGAQMGWNAMKPLLLPASRRSRFWFEAGKVTIFIIFRDNIKL